MLVRRGIGWDDLSAVWVEQLHIPVHVQSHTQSPTQPSVVEWLDGGTPAHLNTRMDLLLSGFAPVIQKGIFFSSELQRFPATLLCAAVRHAFSLPKRMLFSGCAELFSSSAPRSDSVAKNTEDSSTSGGTPNRYAFMLRIRPGAEEAYDAAHRAVWPEMLDLLKSAGISEYSIYRRDDLLILTLRSENFESTCDHIENHPINLRWQAAMAPYFAPVEGLRTGERFPMLEEVFYVP